MMASFSPTTGSADATPATPVSRPAGRRRSTRSRPICAGGPWPPRRAPPTPSTRSSSLAGPRSGTWRPAAIDVRALRRYVAGLSEPVRRRRRSPASSPRCAAVQDPGPARRADREPRRPAQLPEALAAAAAGAQGGRGGGPAGPDSGHVAARAARPGDVRAGLRLRPARRGAGHARCRLRGLWTARPSASRVRAARPAWSRRVSTRCGRWSAIWRAVAPR